MELPGEIRQITFLRDERVLQVDRKLRLAFENPKPFEIVYFVAKRMTEPGPLKSIGVTEDDILENVQGCPRSLTQYWLNYICQSREQSRPYRILDVKVGNDITAELRSHVDALQAFLRNVLFPRPSAPPESGLHPSAKLFAVAPLAKKTFVSGTARYSWESERGTARGTTRGDLTYLRVIEDVLKVGSDEAPQWFRPDGPLAVDFDRCHGTICRREVLAGRLRSVILDNSVSVLVGEAASGKTVLARQVAYELCLEEKYPVYYFDCEPNRKFNQLDLAREINETKGIYVLENMHLAKNKFSEVIRRTRSADRHIVLTARPQYREIGPSTTANLNELRCVEIDHFDEIDALVAMYVSQNRSVRWPRDIVHTIRTRSEDDLWLATQHLAGYVLMKGRGRPQEWVAEGVRRRLRDLGHLWDPDDFNRSYPEAVVVISFLFRYEVLMAEKFLRNVMHVSPLVLDRLVASGVVHKQPGETGAGLYGLRHSRIAEAYWEYGGEYKESLDLPSDDECAFQYITSGSPNGVEAIYAFPARARARVSRRVFAEDRLCSVAMEDTSQFRLLQWIDQYGSLPAACRQETFDFLKHLVGSVDPEEWSVALSICRLAARSPQCRERLIGLLEVRRVAGEIRASGLKGAIEDLLLISELDDSLFRRVLGPSVLSWLGGEIQDFGQFLQGACNLLDAVYRVDKTLAQGLGERIALTRIANRCAVEGDALGRVSFHARSRRPLDRRLFHVTSPSSLNAMLLRGHFLLEFFCCVARITTGGKFENAGARSAKRAESDGVQLPACDHVRKEYAVILVYEEKREMLPHSLNECRYFEQRSWSCVELDRLIGMLHHMSLRSLSRFLFFNHLLAPKVTARICASLDLSHLADRTRSNNSLMYLGELIHNVYLVRKTNALRLWRSSDPVRVAARLTRMRDLTTVAWFIQEIHETDKGLRADLLGLMDPRKLAARMTHKFGVGLLLHILCEIDAGYTKRLIEVLRPEELADGLIRPFYEYQPSLTEPEVEFMHRRMSTTPDRPSGLSWKHRMSMLRKLSHGTQVGVPREFESYCLPCLSRIDRTYAETTCRNLDVHHVALACSFRTAREHLERIHGIDPRVAQEICTLLDPGRLAQGCDIGVAGDLFEAERLTEFMAKIDEAKAIKFKRSVGLES